VGRLLPLAVGGRRVGKGSGSGPSAVGPRSAGVGQQRTWTPQARNGSIRPGAGTPYGAVHARFSLTPTARSSEPGAGNRPGLLRPSLFRRTSSPSEAEIVGDVSRPRTVDHEEPPRPASTAPHADSLPGQNGKAPDLAILQRSARHVANARTAPLKLVSAAAVPLTWISTLRPITCRENA